MEITPAVFARLNAFCEEATIISMEFENERWSQQVVSFLNTALSADKADTFRRLEHDDKWQQLALRLGHLQGLLAKASESEAKSEIDVIEHRRSSRAEQLGHVEGLKKVFVVHGRDNEAKETTARFLERLGLQAVILHEQPNSGRTIIEKFEVYSEDISFVVVLLTPDDVGGLNTSPQKLEPRARQNVILELGYFMGRLGRTRVCALHKGGVELPSDYQGVVYIEMDSHGAWKAKVAQELIQSKISIDLAGLIGG